MARDFNGSSYKLVRTDTCGFSGYPLSMACWFNLDNTTATHALMNFGSTVTSQNYVGLWADGAASGDPINMVHDDIFGATRSNNTTAFSSATWQHAGGVLTSGRIRAWLNGVASTDKSHSLTWPSMNRTSIGVLERGTPALYVDGRLAEAAVWNVELETADFLMLAAGCSPLRVKPAGLVAYWPIIGTDTDEDDAVGGYTLTVTGAAKAAHPRVVRRRPMRWPQIAPAAAPGGTGITSARLVGRGGGLAGVGGLAA